MKKIVYTITLAVLLLGNIALSNTVLAAEGCCIKTNVNDPNVKPTAMDSSKAMCDRVAEKTNNVLKGEFKKNQIADSNGCKPRPPVVTRELGDPVYFTPAVTIPGSEFNAGQKTKIEESTSSLAKYFVAISKYATGIIGIIATIALMAGGILWLTSAGNHEQVGNARTIIGSSLAGLVLAFSSFLILSMVNTNLVNLKITSVEQIKPISTNTGCCEKKDKDGKITAVNIEEDFCREIDYAEPTFKPYEELGWVAQNNTCVATTGCCYQAQKAGFSGNTWCVNNTGLAECNERDSNYFGRFFGNGDIDTKHYIGQKCSDIVECHVARICASQQECIAQEEAERVKEEEENP